MYDFVINLGYALKFFLNVFLDLNIILVKYLNVFMVVVA